MFKWNFGDMLDAIDAVLPPDSLAYAHGDRVMQRAEATRRSNNLARALLQRGARTGDKVAFYMHNRPEYCELLAAAFKARLAPVNVNYRYTPEEVRYILDNSDARVVVFGEEFRPAIAAIRHTLDKADILIEVGPGCDFAQSFDALADEGDGAPLNIERDGDDLLFIYTGGTTGLPKGVMWRHHDLRELTLRSLRLMGPVPETIEALAREVRRKGPAAPSLIAPPLMHGTGLLTAMAAMFDGGGVVTLAQKHYEAAEVLDALQRWGAASLTIVGDPFARPLVEALDAHPGRWKPDFVERVTSSGVMWSVEVKRGLLRHMPKAVLSDSFSSSEAIGLGVSLMTAAGEVQTAHFALSDRTRVFDENDQPVVPGSGVQGLVAVGAPNPVGYYKDPEKTARTFREIGGQRYAIPGDWCLVEADGSITLLGRGSACINTAGEKVFPEEVEEVLKHHASVEDALVVGLPDPKWGQSVAAVVRLKPGFSLDERGLIDQCRASLAHYKAPKKVVATDRSLRAPNGKADYAAAREVAG